MAAAPGSAVFLFLRGDEAAGSDAWRAMVARLRPDVAVAADLGTAAPPMVAGFADCVAGTSFGKPEYVQRARNWWSSMAAAWALVAAKEAADGRYDAVVFSRPDILFGGDMGPHCAYDRSTWYSGGKGSPDHFWILPRDAAADVLGGSLDAFETCAGAGAPCCARTSPLGGNMFSWDNVPLPCAYRSNGSLASSFFVGTMRNPCAFYASLAQYYPAQAFNEPFGGAWAEGETVPFRTFKPETNDSRRTWAREGELFAGSAAGPDPAVLRDYVDATRRGGLGYFPTTSGRRTCATTASTRT
ncbi:hypothetical protein JL722_7801 [Aureococcus anophagefferens]|nr:hypothetical protein JL722_7801 [Aureococcus anophagefferens]